MEYDGQHRKIHSAENDDAHYVVEDHFNGRRWRFELHEAEKMRALLSDPHEAPSSATVHVVGSVQDVTDKWVDPKWRPRNWRPVEERLQPVWRTPDYGMDDTPGNQARAAYLAASPDAVEDNG